MKITGRFVVICQLIDLMETNKKLPTDIQSNLSKHAQNKGVRE